MPNIVWAVENTEPWAEIWGAEFVRLEEDGSTTILGVSNRQPPIYSIHEPIIFNQFLDTTGFFVFEVVGNDEGEHRQVDLAFPSFGENMTLPQTDAMFHLDAGGGGLELSGLVTVLLIFLGLALLVRRR